MRRPRQLTFDDVRYTTGRGGPRRGAGRPRGERSRVLHRAREAIPNRFPVHVTLRLRNGYPSLRTGRFVRAFRRTLAEACARRCFRVVHYSVQRDHIHLLVEAQGKQTLACGMKSVGARVGLTVNRVFRRSGPVLDGRYHHHVLRNPREVRYALAYVLLNNRHHWLERFGEAPPVRLDEASSGKWFDGWRGVHHDPPDREREVAAPGTWLLSTGWRRWKLIDPAEVPGPDLRGTRPALRR